jgi:phosphoribosylglycinamide formyltransferase-1
VTGNTIHGVDENIDEGSPVIVSTLNIPYDEDIKLVRHRLFIQECKTLLQVVSWLNQDRIVVDDNGRAFVEGAKFSEPYYSPNIEDDEIVKFDLKYPWL